MWRIALVATGVAAAVLIGHAASAQPAAPAVPTLAVQKAKLQTPTQLVVDGTIQCKAGTNFTITANVTELGSDASVRRSPISTGPCTTDGSQAWSVTVPGSGGTFVPVVTAFGTITDPATQKSTTNVVQGGVDIVKA